MTRELSAALRALLEEEGAGPQGRNVHLEERMLISLDVETGGLDAEANPLLQVSLWRPDGPGYEVRIKGDPARCHPRALQANGLDPTQGMEPADAAASLVQWWKSIDSPQFHLIGQNVGPFDVPFLKQLTKVGVDVPWSMMFDYHYRDTGTLALALQDAGILHFGKWSLTNICQVLGILYDPHICRADAKAAWYAWHRMQEVLMHLRDNNNVIEGHSKEGCSGIDQTREINHSLRAHLPALDLRG